MKNIAIIALLVISFSCKKNDETPAPSDPVSNLNGDTAVVSLLYGSAMDNLTYNIRFYTGLTQNYDCVYHTSFSGGGDASSPKKVLVKLKGAPKTGTYDIEMDITHNSTTSACVKNGISITYKDSIGGKILVATFCKVASF